MTLYDTITPEESPLAARIRELLKEGAIDAVTFTSGSTVQGFLDILQPDKETLNGFTAVCIGEKQKNRQRGGNESRTGGVRLGRRD